MAETLYGLSGYGSTASYLYSLNLSTGAATSIGPVGFTNCFGLAYNGSTMYAIQNLTSPKLLTINLATGAGTVVATISPAIGGGMYFPDACFSGTVLLSWNESGFPTTIPTDQLVTINISTGVFTSGTLATFITPAGTGLARNPITGTIFVKGGDTFDRVNQTTGTTSVYSILTGPLGTDLSEGFTFNASGVAYALDRNAGKLFTINPLTPSTCVGQLVGLVGNTLMTSIEFGPTLSAAHSLSGIYSMGSDLTVRRTADRVYLTIGTSSGTIAPTTTAEERAIPEPSATLYGVGDE